MFEGQDFLGVGQCLLLSRWQVNITNMKELTFVGLSLSSNMSQNKAMSVFSMIRDVSKSIQRFHSGF